MNTKFSLKEVLLLYHDLFVNIHYVTELLMLNVKNLCCSTGPYVAENLLKTAKSSGGRTILILFKRYQFTTKILKSLLAECYERKIIPVGALLIISTTQVEPRKNCYC